MCTSITEPSVCNRCLKNEKNRKYNENRFRDLQRKHKILKLKYLKSIKSVSNYKCKWNTIKIKRKAEAIVCSVIDKVDVGEKAKTLTKLLVTNRVSEFTQKERELALNIHKNQTRHIRF